MNQNRILIILFLAFCFYQTGCATLAPQTEMILTLANENKANPLTHQIKDVPFINQQRGQCGPSSLMMVMLWAGGSKINLDELINQVYTPAENGSLQMDLISASRRNGYLTVPISSMSELLAEVRANHPVIIFENLALKWTPQWHYAVVTGYDLTKPEIIMHTGPLANSHVDMREFESSWKLGDYWGLVVLPPDQLPISLDELSILNEAATLEKIGQLKPAKVAYLQILKKWPSSLGGHIGLGNIAFSEGDLITANKYLLRAAEWHAESPALWHNLAIVQESLKQHTKAKESARKAITLAPLETKKIYRESLKNII